MDESNERYEQARARARQLRGFYVHLAWYVAINIMLLAINLLTNRDSLWFYWPLLGWGIGVAAHAISVFALGGRFGDDWEERKARELMERDRR